MNPKACTLSTNVFGLLVVGLLVLSQSTSYAERGRAKSGRPGELEKSEGELVKEKAGEGKEIEELRTKLKKPTGTVKTNNGSTSTRTNRLKRPTGDVEAETFESHETIPGKKELGNVGTGRVSAPRVTRTAQQRAELKEAAKKEDAELEATLESKGKLETIESEIKLFKNSGKETNFSKDQSSQEAIERILDKAGAKEGSDMEIALRVMAEKMIAQGKSLTEAEAAITEFIGFWNSKAQHLLSAEDRAGALEALLALFHRNPKALSAQVKKIEEFIKGDKDGKPEDVIRGLVLTAKSFAPKFFAELRKGTDLHNAHKAGLSDMVEFLRTKLTDAEILELKSCLTPLGFARQLLGLAA